MVRAADHHIHHVIDGHQALHELLQRRPVFRDQPSIAELAVIHHAGEENRAQLIEVLGHRNASYLDEVPTER